ncbi:Hypothetical predicted protein [Mytilus galloprovincialis]|uniref:Uncharacterized protein n=1 Tax=Mytilus galloprovincialis TaxID=29158 RepID=A0A8B6BU54_MYTGA|nr:Hypothetical predicted protein [Mytilus galloprovincialis]
MSDSLKKNQPLWQDIQHVSNQIIYGEDASEEELEETQHVIPEQGEDSPSKYPWRRNSIQTCATKELHDRQEHILTIKLFQHESNDSDEPNLINLDTPDHIDVIVHVQQAKNLNNQPLETVNEIIEPENLLNNIETNTDSDIMASGGVALPKFYDEFNNIPVEWWYLFESFKIFHNLQDDRALALPAFNFDGQVKVWLQSLAPEVRNDMAAFKDFRTISQIS